ncbi:hypothetical protein K1T71_010226 [Dendrolimus kikuchii]|uniref:Uncharacterized protein n=1 Tax=Dendrolimus kikuchii TaxID=765133 RepID=A0ACC1CRN8_9NEOP|nr:hypothetical protein K1T71_010226 [Dendrolimus kikuchii]
MGDSSSEPDLHLSPDTEVFDSNIILKRKKVAVDSLEGISKTMQTMFSGLQVMFQDLKASHNEQFLQIKNDMNSLKEQNEHLLASNLEIKSSVSKIIQDHNELKTRVESLENSNTKSADYIRTLEQQLETVDRKIRETSIEIHNLPTENNTQMLSLIGKLHTFLNINYKPSDLRNALRLPSKINKPRPIILEYTNMEKKMEFLRAYKQFIKNNNEKKLTSACLGLSTENSAIYVNDLLTRKAKNLHYLARQFVKSRNWKYCWTSRGKVFIRKDDGQPSVEVKSAEQIAKLYKDMLSDI